ncbi:hypothetical protein PIB30_113345, partial [Stylosanthes scabra]|nr:hypothetical protein [Stylosanthes scabra]
MHGRQASSQRLQPHAHASKQRLCVSQEHQSYRFKPSLSYEDPRIGMVVHAYAWKKCSNIPREQQLPRICVESHAYAWKQSRTGQN